MRQAGEKKRYNLRDVASRAGVSVATVSRVVNAPDRVSPATRSRVEKAIAELRFVPSAAARAINSGRTRMVAALLPTLDNSIYARLVDGLESRLSDFGLSLMVAQTTGDPDIEHARARKLIDIGAEGMVIVGLTHSAALQDLIAYTQMPALTVSCFDPTYLLPTIGYDNAEAARIAVDHLVGLGHRQIGVVHGPLHNNDRAAQRKTAIGTLRGPTQFSYLETDLSFEGGCAAARRFAGQHKGSSALLCFSDILAMGAITELQRIGLSVPEDISVLGMEDLPASAAFNPPLTSVQLQVQRMGEDAAEALAYWVEKGERPAPMCLPARLIARASTRALAPSDLAGG